MADLIQNSSQQLARDASTASIEEHAALLESILDDSNQMIQLSTLDDMRMVYANEPARAYTGHGGESYRGCRCYEYMMGLPQQCPFCPMLTMGDADEAETEVDNGQQVFAVKTKRVVFNGDEAFIEYARDVTQVRRAQQNFEAQMSTLLQSIPDAQGVMHFDLTSNECLSVNGSAVNNLKSVQSAVPVDETMGQIFSFVPDESLRTELLGIFNRDALLAAYEDGQVELSRETPSYFDDGSVRPARVSVRLVANPTTNHVECVFFGQDISEEVAEREALQRELEEQSTIFNALSRDFLNVFLANPVKGTIRILKLDGYVTPGISVGSTADYPYNDVRDNYVFSRVHPDDQHMMIQALSLESVVDGLAQSDEYVGTYRVLDDGETHSYQYKYVKTDDPEHVIAGFQNVDAIVADDRERQQTLADALVAAEQASLAKSTFLSSMSHDIRTPLNAITGFAGLARDHTDDPQALERYLDKIDTASEHLLSLINDVLDMSSIESGRVHVADEPVNLKTLAGELQTIVSDTADKKNIALTFDLDGVEHPDVRADQLKIKKVLLNILGNAVKFTPVGGKVSFSVTEDPEELAAGLPRYVFVVRDTGVGMDKDFVAHVFETFSREDGVTEQGTGLGMSIAKSLVDLMGGTISVKSEKGRGSEFTVALRLEPVRGTDEEAAETADKADGEYSLENRHVLLVEDNELNREIAVEILRAAGAVVETAADGAEAVAVVTGAEPGHFDVVLMDIQMPRMNGYEAARAIRGLKDPLRAAVPILAVTANAFDTDKAAALEAGMDGHIAKPIDVSLLLSAMTEVLSGR